MNWLEILLLIFIVSIIFCFISDKFRSERMVSFFGMIILMSGMFLFVFGFVAGLSNSEIKENIINHQILYEAYQQNKNIDFEDHKEIVKSNRKIRVYKEVNKSIWRDPFYLDRYLDRVEEIKLIEIKPNNNGN